MQMAFPFTYTLATPVVVRGQTWKTVIVRAPRAGDYFAIFGKGLPDWEETLSLIEALIEVPREVIAEFDPRDYFELVEVVRPFSLARRFQPSASSSPISLAPSDGPFPTSSP